MRKAGRMGLTLLLLAVMTLPCAAAQAEFSPLYAAMAAEDGMQVEAAAHFEILSPLSDRSLAIVNDWLARMRLRAAFFRRDGFTQTEGTILLDQQKWLSVSERRDAEKTLTFFLGGGGYITAAGESSALSLLAGTGDGLPQVMPLLQSYVSTAPAMRALLDAVKAPKHSNDDTSVKNAAASASYDSYTLTEEEMNVLWPGMLALIMPQVRMVLADMPAALEKAERLLGGLVFSGQCRFKCLYDKAGADMGLQFTGNAGYDGDVRKVTLFGGFTPGRGGYVSLSLPAVKGKNNFKVTFTGKLADKEEKKTLTLEGTYSNTLNGQKDTASLDAALTNLIGQGTEEWTGKIEINTDFAGEKNKRVFSPRLTLDETGLHGEIETQRTSGKRTLAKGSLTLALTRPGEPETPEGREAQDLRGLTAAEAKARTQGEMIPLTTALVRLLSALPEESRAALAHDLRSEDWMNGPAVPVLPGQDGIPQKNAPENDQWIVSEEVEE